MTEYANADALVETDWLAAHLSDPDIRIIEMDLDPTEYQNCHLPGAVFWQAMAPLDENRATIADPARLSALLGQAGIGPSTRVIAVHGAYAATSGWLYWFFKRLGHDRVHVLNGGREKWLADRYAMTSDESVPEPTEYPVSSIDISQSATLGDVRAGIEDRGTVIVDVRSSAEFSGEIYLNAPPQPGEITGHIPGAVHIPYEIAHRDDGTFKTAEDLKTLFAQAGVTSDKSVIPYCAVGARSAHCWFVLSQLLGFDRVRNFDGSWREWSVTPGMPIANEGVTTLGCGKTDGQYHA